MVQNPKTPEAMDFQPSQHLFYVVETDTQGDAGNSGLGEEVYYESCQQPEETKYYRQKADYIAALADHDYHSSCGGRDYLSRCIKRVSNEEENKTCDIESTDYALELNAQSGEESAFSFASSYYPSVFSSLSQPSITGLKRPHPLPDSSDISDETDCKLLKLMQKIVEVEREDFNAERERCERIERGSATLDRIYAGL